MPVKKSELYSILWEACNKLRGGVEPARYKDYVLVLLFFKYVSDKYNNDPYSDFTVPDDATFEILINAKGKKDVGEIVNKTLSKFIEANGLRGDLPEVSFENTNELGTGKVLVDKVSGLIGVFQELDFSSNRANGDDIIGDAYEYFMMKFAQESGKSKGQFYTPGEVSRIIARLIGIENISEQSTIYDPAAGSGSLLIRAADEAPLNSHGDPLISIYGQEIDNSTAGLAKMNFILHQKNTGEIEKGNTLSDPKYKDKFGQLRRFDFVVMNPPFSDKSWSDGVNIKNDIYHRFDGFGTPPEKNGDYAWLLHVIKSLNTNGKAGIVMPHGVLFRGNAEEAIRINLLKTRYIKGIISLPQNLFYGTGIPACLIFIDKENAENRENIFFIDASEGFKKDGNKNRLREQDIEKIVRVYKSQEEISGYSRLVSYSEILDNNAGNMNVPRYIQKIYNDLPQNIAAHLYGGIPKNDIQSLNKIWKISPELKEYIFEDTGRDIYKLTINADEIENFFETDENLQAQKIKEGREIFNVWGRKAREFLLNINENTNPKILIRELGNMILNDYENSLIIDKYCVFDCLMNYWNEILQDDIYLIKSDGYEAGRSISFQYDKSGKVKNFDGELIPRKIIERYYLFNMIKSIETFEEQVNSLKSEIEDLQEEAKDENEELNLTSEAAKIIREKDSKVKNLSQELKKLYKRLDETVLKIYSDLTMEEIKEILFNEKWMERLQQDINNEIESVLNLYISRLVMLAKRYARPLKEIEEEQDIVIYDFKGRRVLVAEDDSLSREILVEALTAEGFIVDEAIDGSFAIEKLRDNESGTYELVILDLQMPVMDGYETTKIIRKFSEEKVRDIPIVALTADVFPEEKSKAFACGVNAYLLKPVDMPALLKVLMLFFRENKRS